MFSQIPVILLLGAGLLALDIYLFGGLVAAFKKRAFFAKKGFRIAYFAFSVILITATICCIYLKLPTGIRAGFLMVFFVLMIVKVTFLPFVLADDIRRLLVELKRKKTSPAAPSTTKTDKDAIPRSEFLMKAGLITGIVPLAGIGMGIYSGAYDYRVRRQVLYLPNLPKSFDGITIGQISDVHSGSFYNKKAVLGGIEMLLGQKPDVIFFTGDLVNKRSDEMYGYQDIFGKVKAPLGVFSILGNHDYGDYYHEWPSAAAKRKNLDDLKATHKNMGWDLLLNENRRLKVNGEEIGILGCENWGELTRFPKYGKMEPTVKGSDDLPVKLLLSHDPSHWRAQVLQKYPQIDVMFSGHTHGMQFGVRTDNFQWSPVEYVYKEWAGLYHQGNQQLYVNVGYGFLGFPGRVGILPEITIFELKAIADPALSKS